MRDCLELFVPREKQKEIMGGKEDGSGTNDMGQDAKHQIFPPVQPLEHISDNNMSP